MLSLGQASAAPSIGACPPDRMRPSILPSLDVTIGDLEIPGFRTHRLKGRLGGHWSIWVNGNWRVTFRFVDADVELVDYLDYH